MNENDLKIIKYLVIGSVAIFVAGLGSCQSTRYQKRMAIEAGASPMAAYCSIEGLSRQGGCYAIAVAEADAARNASH